MTRKTTRRKRRRKKKEPFKPDQARRNSSISTGEEGKFPWVFAVAFAPMARRGGGVSRQHREKSGISCEEGRATLQGHPTETKVWPMPRARSSSARQMEQEEESLEGEIKIWSATDGKGANRSKAHTAASIAWRFPRTENSRSASEDKTVIIWDSRPAGRADDQGPHRGHPQLSFSPDGKQVVDHEPGQDRPRLGRCRRQELAVQGRTRG